MYWIKSWQCLRQNRYNHTVVQALEKPNPRGRELPWERKSSSSSIIFDSSLLGDFGREKLELLTTFSET